MAEKNIMPARCEEQRQTMSIHTRKITDSCRDKDCIEDLRVYLTQSSQTILDSATSAKVRCADLIYTYIDVEPVAFDRSHFCVDVTFFYRILADAGVGSTRPASLHGLAVFSKRAVLCGEDSAAHIFTSDTRIHAPDGLSSMSRNLPVAVVEVLDPMVLAGKTLDVCQCPCQDGTLTQLPEGIVALFDEQLVLSGESRRLYVTLGQFSIIRLERDVQISVPVIGYSIPSKQCCESAGCAEDPCEVFSRIPFPEDRFSPRDCDDCPCAEGSYTTTG